MIRINLLPVKQSRRKEAARNQILFGLLILGVEATVCFVIFLTASDSIEEQRNVNKTVQASVDKIKKQIVDHPQILSEITEFDRRQNAIASLQAARTGPVHIMLELSSMLSKGGKPQIDHDRYQEMIQVDPTAGYDENWDYRRLWIDGFAEKDRVVRINGQALTHEDVAEFLRRINLSDFFLKSRLLRTDLSLPTLLAGMKDEKGQPVVHFEIEATVRYN